MERITLSIGEWMSLREDGGDAPPIWFTVNGGSMFPLIRARRDQVMLVSVDPEEIRAGDIVLFPGHYRGGDYCLHRVYRLDGDRVQTFGDGNLSPDGWIPRTRILGRVSQIRRGKRTIDCDDPKWRRRANAWRAMRKARRVLLLPHRFADRIERLINKKAHG